MINYNTNELDIAYYEFMIDQIQEDQKIHEMLTISKYSHILEGFDDKQIAIYENKVIDSIMDFIKKIIEKLSNFFNKAIDAIKKVKNNASDKQLYSACEKKIKSMEKEDAKKFHTQISYNIAEIEDEIKYVKSCILDSQKLFDQAKDLFEQALPDPSKIISLYWKGEGIDRQVSAMKERVKEFSEKLNYNKEKEQGEEYIDYDAVLMILNECKAMDSEVNKAETDLKNTDKEIKFFRSWADNAVKRNINVEAAKDCRIILTDYSNCSIKLFKKYVSLYILKNNLYKGALRKFIAYKPQSASNESAEYFERLLESIMYEETGGEELCMS